jgi:tRNA pseudouridine38-40 synthase
MARYQLILAYDGARFEGSQRQAKKRTAQGELEKALRTLGWTGRSVLIAGRTDSGVHAEGQSVALDLEWAHGPDKLRAALNASLPSDLAVRDAREVSPDFHPRFDADSRRYRYRLFCDPVRDPVRERYAWRVWPAMDGATLNLVAPVFLGRHDFAAFGSPMSRGGSTVRTVSLSAWTESEGEWQFQVRADAFLYRMVRRLVFVQVMAAQGRLSVEQVRHSLETQERLPAGLAPAHGLSLVEVTYTDQSKIENRKLQVE